MIARSTLAPVQPKGRAEWLWLGGIVFAALLAFMPLRLALAIAGTGSAGFSARAAGGTLWSGRLVDARFGALDVGTLDTGLDVLPLLIGRLRLNLKHIDGASLEGAAEIGWSRRAIYGVTGNLNGGRIGGLLIDQFAAEALNIEFGGSRCVQASGRVRLSIAAGTVGVNRQMGLSGVARCDNGALLLPLTSESGAERLMLRIEGDGRYSGTLGNEAAAAPLRIEGRL